MLEQRVALRFRPRRTLTLNLTLPFDADGLGLVQWLAANQGRPAWIPLPHLCRTVVTAALKMDELLEIDLADQPFLAALQRQDSENNSLPFGGYGLNTEYGELLVLDEINGWQRVQAHQDSGNTLRLDEPLARPVAAGTRVYPALLGTIRNAVNLEHAASRVIEMTLDVEVAAPAYSYLSDGGWTPTTSYKGLPVLHCASAGNDWSDALAIGFDAGIQVLDADTAPVWSQRISDRNHETLARRLFVQGDAAIFDVRGLLDYCRGRLQPLWLDEQIGGIDLLQPALAGADRLIIKRANLPAWVHSGAVLWVRQAGLDAFALGMAGMASIDQASAALMLAEPLPYDLDASVRITRLLYVRLDHDAIDLIYHTPQLLEVNLRFIVIPFTAAAVTGY